MIAEDRGMKTQSICFLFGLTVETNVDNIYRSYAKMLTFVKFNWKERDGKMELDNVEVHMCIYRKTFQGINGAVDDHMCIKQTIQHLKPSNGNMWEERKREWALVKGVVYNTWKLIRWYINSKKTNEFILKKY